MVLLGFAFLALAVVTAFLGWKTGFYACIAIALAQDPLRKLAEGAPVYFVVLVGVVFAAAWLGAATHGVRLGPNVIAGANRLRLPFILFAALIVVQAVHSFAKWENFALPAIGLLTYFAALPAVILAYQFALRSGLLETKRLLLFYILLVIPLLAGVALEFYGVRWPVLGEVGVGQFVYDTGEGKSKLPAGFFRSAETAAWHVTNCACLLFVVLRGRKLSVPATILVVVGVVFLATIGVMTGRRKLLVQITVFVAVFYALTVLFLKGKEKAAIVTIVAGVLGFFAVAMYTIPSDQQMDRRQNYSGVKDRYEGFKARGGSVWDEIPDRFQKLGLNTVPESIDQHGWLGAGLGTGSQGAQHFGGGAKKFGGSAEGGFGKITQELGVPGLILYAWFVIALTSRSDARASWLPTSQHSLSQRRCSAISSSCYTWVGCSDFYSQFRR
jgi:hypothetical protein